MPLHLHILNLGKQSDNNNVLVKILWYLLDNKGFKKMRSSSKSTDLVKVDEKKSNLPIKLNPNEIKHALELVDKDLFLKNRDDVKKFLPDILGRVLARIWMIKILKIASNQIQNLFWIKMVFIYLTI